MSLHAVFHEGYAPPLPPGHRFPMSKFARLAALLRDEGVVERFHTPEPAARADLVRAHNPAYVDAVLTCRLNAAAERRIGFAITPPVARRAQLATGGTLLAARLALAHGVACNAAGGSHHAGRAHGAGFSVFNDVAVAARTLLEKGCVRRVLVLDCDVHQGDGTAEICAGDPAIVTVSVHCDQNFPVRKQASWRDVGLPAGTGDADYLQALADLVPAVLDEVRPDLLFYNAGVDVHEADRLGKLKLTDAGIAARDARVFSACASRGVPVAGVIGGGYADDVGVLAHRHAILFRTATEARARFG